MGCKMAANGRLATATDTLGAWEGGGGVGEVHFLSVIYNSTAYYVY